MSDRTAWKITSENGWWSVFGKKKGKGSKPGPPVHDDLCAVTDEDGRTRHVFAADGPNQLWLTDITEHWTAEGKLYLCVVKDVWGNKIVGCSIGSRMQARLAVQALENAVQMRGDVAMESFFALLQQNVLNRHRWASSDQLRIAIVTWVERTYHRRRKQASLGRLTPVEFEAIMNTTVALAA